MAIQSRRGLEIDFDPNKLISGEYAGTLDTKKAFYAFAPGDVKQLSTYEDMKADIEQAQEEITDGLTEGVNLVITEANTSIDNINQANTAIQAAEATRQQQELDRQANTATAIQNTDDATDRANQAADDVNSILLGSIATDTTLGVVKGGDIIIESDGTLNLPSNSVLLEDTEEPLEPEIPTDTDLLGGHPASYFDNKITSNTNSINTINTNLSKWHFYHTVVDFAGSVYIDIAIPNITITVPVFVTNADQASGGAYITGTTIPATGTLRIYLNTAWPGGLRISIFWYL